MFNELFPNVVWDKIWAATMETLYMTAVSVVATFVLGILLGLLLFLTSKGNIWENRFINGVIASFVNIFRSIPFIILIILLIPFTKLVVGTILGADAALPALIIVPPRFMHAWLKLRFVKLIKVSLKRQKRWGQRQQQLFGKCFSLKRCQHLYLVLQLQRSRSLVIQRWQELSVLGAWKLSVFRRISTQQ